MTTLVQPADEPTFVELIEKDLMYQASDAEVQKLEVDPHAWREYLVLRIARLEDEILEVKKSKWVGGKASKLVAEQALQNLGVTKRKIQKKLSEVKFLVKEANIEINKKMEAAIGRDVVTGERVDVATMFLDLKKEIQEMKDLIANLSCGWGEKR